MAATRVKLILENHFKTWKIELLFQVLIDDVNRLIPGLDQLEREIRILPRSHSGREAFNAALSVMYDRWDTIRMQATSKQSTIEVDGRCCLCATLIVIWLANSKCFLLLYLWYFSCTMRFIYLLPAT